ncbi:ribonuclease R [Hyphococcus luteus]|uniref:Ribonuclease R n=1 Tax=Hyphococcus luteus TaxID=2058213 RepID=A0A2S7JZR7_9PROT|nr:ribonuclease R [Marinicaulis flavus]PQA85740.1 ribonuclease R [Marinicaulis flavus]
MAKRAKPSSPRKSGGLPSKKDIIAYLENADGETARRDIARAFGVKGEARADLRALLKEMDADGSINVKGGKRIERADTLPPVAPIDVMSVDDDGDLLCMPANWRGETEPPMIRLSARRAAKVKPPPGVGDRLLARLFPAGDDGYDASVIKAIGKGAHRFLAVYRERRRGGVAEPVERRARDTFTIDEGDAHGAKDGDLVWVETKNKRGYGPKKARIRSIAGHIDDKHAFSLIALANHGIPTDFPPEVLAEAEKAKLPDLGERTDLRATPLITIDPADAKDHDDAVFAKADDDPDNQGGFRVTVAIADVSYFVKPDSALDKEALKRGNSTYLPDRVVPMLPERLSNDLCSLKPDVDRPCLAVEMVITAGGVKKSHRFMRAMMRSHARLSYEDAQAISEGGKASKELKSVVTHLYDAFHARMKERAKRAPLDLDLPERKIILDDNGDVEKVVKRERFDAHRVIEEFMILANVAAAEALERARTPLIYRVHDEPDEEKLESVRDYLDTLDYSLSKGAVRPANFNQLLKIAGERDQKEMVSEVVLRSQKQAIYDTENIGHFGINLGRYTHFTSPIRRYADLTVHRSLVKAFKLGPNGQTEKEAKALPKIAETISDLERRSIAAERESNDRYLAGYLEDRVGAEFEARIRGVTKFGLFVMLDESGADGFIPMRSIGAERYRFEEKDHAVIGETTGGMYRLGQAVKVRLEEAAPLTGGLRFEMLSDPLPGAPKRKGTVGQPSKPGHGRKAAAKKRGASKGKGAKAAKDKPANKKKRRSKANAKPRRG